MSLALALVARGATVETPSFDPPSGAAVPVNVRLQCATPEAVIRYTLDGTVPTLNSPVYYTGLDFVSLTTVRARAFKDGLEPSDTAFADYGEVQRAPEVGYYRSVTMETPSSAPQITVRLPGASNVTCVSIEERLPSALEAFDVAGGGTWLPELGVIRWGPFVQVASIEVSYRVRGPGGVFAVGGAATVDGRWTLEPGETSVEIPMVIDTNVPVRPVAAAAPVITSDPGLRVPATVTLASTTPGAELRYTLDGTLPSESSQLYVGPFTVDQPGTLRARTFAGGFAPSEAVVAFFGAAISVGPSELIRLADTNAPGGPVMQLTWTPGSGAAASAFEERVPAELIVTNVTGGGLLADGVVRWGPFGGNETRVFSYQVLGPGGSYRVSARWSFDGQGLDLDEANIEVPVSTVPIVVPVKPERLAMPVLSPSTASILPVQVSITGPAGAELRYTVDGTRPTTSSALYASDVPVIVPTTLRVGAFREGWEPSDATVGFYGALGNDAGTATVTRTIPENNTTQPLISLEVVPQGPVRSYTITENVPWPLEPAVVGQNGVWSADSRTLKWGPFPGGAVVLSYRLSGPAGTFACVGSASVDGYAREISGENTLLVTGTAVDTTVPERPRKLPTPTVTPLVSAVLPVVATAVSTVEGANLRFTIDGTLPTEGSALFSGALEFRGTTVLRVRAFLAGWEASDAAVAYFQAPDTASGLTVTRHVTESPGYAPQVELKAVPSGPVAAYAVVENIPEGITPFHVTPPARWDPERRTLNWGVFGQEANTFAYQVSGYSATNVLEGRGSVDGMSVEVGGDTNVAVDLTKMPELAAPAITLAPLSQTVAVGYRFLLYVEAVGAPELTYQWRKDGAPIDGETSPVLQRLQFRAEDMGTYDVVVSNAFGQAGSTPAFISTITGPRITRQPRGLTARPGQSAVFTVEASGNPAPTYQWRVNGVPLPGKTAAILVLDKVNASNAGSYDVVVSNLVSQENSESALLEVISTALSIGGVSKSANGDVRIELQALAGRRYTLEYTDDLNEPGWRTLASMLAEVAGPLILTDAPGALAQRFYRLREE